MSYSGEANAAIPKGGTLIPLATGPAGQPAGEACGGCGRVLTEQPAVDTLHPVRRQTIKTRALDACMPVPTGLGRGGESSSSPGGAVGAVPRARGLPPALATTTAATPPRRPAVAMPTRHNRRILAHGAAAAATNPPRLSPCRSIPSSRGGLAGLTARAGSLIMATPAEHSTVGAYTWVVQCGGGAKNPKYISLKIGRNFYNFFLN